MVEDIVLSDEWQLTPLKETDAEDFHSLVIDPHIRRYLMDGKELPRQWSQEQVSLSERGFLNSGLGLWLVKRRDSQLAIGFAGFMSLSGTGLEVEFVYALREKFTGLGLATKIASQLIKYATDCNQVRSLSASVDAVNKASVRILEKLGFVHSGTKAGEFGDLFIYRLVLRR